MHHTGGSLDMTPESQACFLPTTPNTIPPLLKLLLQKELYPKTAVSWMHPEHNPNMATPQKWMVGLQYRAWLGEDGSQAPEHFIVK